MYGWEYNTTFDKGYFYVEIQLKTKFQILKYPHGIRNTNWEIIKPFCSVIYLENNVPTNDLTNDMVAF